MTDFDVLPAGDSALVLRFSPRIDPAISGRAIAVSNAVSARFGTIVKDVVVGYCSVTVYFDPLEVDAGWLDGELHKVATDTDEGEEVAGPLIDVPVCYGGECGPDLADVAVAARCTEEEVVALHAGRTYRVYVVGFVPGFPYMATVDDRLALPRRASPRTTVPPGSVAIAGGQTGIYPAETPGGWHLIGRTPLKPYDASRPHPFLFKPGDRVRFHPIDRATFERTS